jgi:hypothetical protein
MVLCGRREREGAPRTHVIISEARALLVKKKMSS